MPTFFTVLMYVYLYISDMVLSLRWESQLCLSVAALLWLIYHFKKRKLNSGQITSENLQVQDLISKKYSITKENSESIGLFTLEMNARIISLASSYLEMKNQLIYDFFSDDEE